MTESQGFKVQSAAVSYTHLDVYKRQHYPIPLHLQKAYEAFGFKNGGFPVTEKVAAEILSLPMYPQLQAVAQSRVVQKIQEFAAVGALR